MKKKLRSKYVELLNRQPIEYLKENNLLVVLDYLNTPNDKELFKKAVVRCSVDWMFVEFQEHMIFGYLEEQETAIKKQECLHTENYIYSKEEVSEKYNVLLENDIIKMIEYFNNIVYDMFKVDNFVADIYIYTFESLKSYISEENKWSMYPYQREQLFLEYHGYNSYMSYSDFTIKDVLNIAHQLQWRLDKYSAKI